MQCDLLAATQYKRLGATFYCLSLSVNRQLQKAPCHLLAATRYERIVDTGQELLLYARDKYNNIVTDAAFSNRVTNITVSPSNVSWNAVVTSSTAAAASITVR
jgi:hypothetical protein